MCLSNKLRWIVGSQAVATSATPACKECLWKICQEFQSDWQCKATLLLYLSNSFIYFAQNNLNNDFWDSVLDYSIPARARVVIVGYACTPCHVQCCSVIPRIKSVSLAQGTTTAKIGGQEKLGTGGLVLPTEGAGHQGLDCPLSLAIQDSYPAR